MKISSKERVLVALHHREPDRVPVFDNPSPSTIKRWEKEGLPDGIAPDEYFGWDIMEYQLDMSVESQAGDNIYTKVNWLDLKKILQTAQSKEKFLALGAQYSQAGAKALKDIVELIIKEGIKFDGVFLYNDMALTPEIYRESFFDTDREVCKFFHRQGLQVILHNKRNCKPFLPELIEAGLDCISSDDPAMEPAALKKAFGVRISLMGGISAGKSGEAGLESIEQEMQEKFSVAKKGGGFICRLSNLVPEGTSFSRYCEIADIVQKFIKYG